MVKELRAENVRLANERNGAYRELLELLEARRDAGQRHGERLMTSVALSVCRTSAMFPESRTFGLCDIASPFFLLNCQA